MKSFNLGSRLMGMFKGFKKDPRDKFTIAKHAGVYNRPDGLSWLHSWSSFRLRRMDAKSCACCGKRFTPLSFNKHKVCSGKCAIKHHRLPVSKFA